MTKQYQPEIAKNIILLGELRQQDQENVEVIKAIHKMETLVDNQLRGVKW